VLVLTLPFQQMTALRAKCSLLIFDRAQTDFIHLQMDLANTSVPSPRSIGIHQKQITTGQHHSFSENHHRLNDLNTGC